MRVTYDAESDMAYIHLQEVDPGGVATTVPGWPGTAAFCINLDFDSVGRLVGIDVDGAAQRLPSTILEAAERL